MKTDPTQKKPAAGAKAIKIQTDMPMSEKDEVKKAEDKMRKTSQKSKGNN